MTALGLALLVIGAIAVVTESHVPTVGMIGGPGVLALGAGAILAVSGLGGGVALGLGIALLLVAGSGALVAVSLREGIAVRRRRVRSGPERLVGHPGVVHSWDEASGTVRVDGALWRARRDWSEEHAEALAAGEPVVVERLHGLTLSVRRAEPWEVEL